MSSQQVKEKSFFKKLIFNRYVLFGIIVYFVLVVISTIFNLNFNKQKVFANPISHGKKIVFYRIFSPFNIFGVEAYGTETVAVIRLEGQIFKGVVDYGISSDKVDRLLKKLNYISNLKSILISIDSPGGSPFESELISYRISEISNKFKVPVYSFIEAYGASGGYWIACAADKVFASKNSLVGSIGVISSGFGFVDVISKLGIERRHFTEGTYKGSLDPFLPIQENDLVFEKQLLKSFYDNFVLYVKERRGDRINLDNQELLFSGLVWTGDKALGLGLIDGLEDVSSFILKNYPEAHVIYITEKVNGFLKRRFISFFKNFGAKELLRILYNHMIGSSLSDDLITNQILKSQMLGDSYNSRILYLYQ